MMVTGLVLQQAAPGASASQSSCCPTDRARCSTTCWARRAPVCSTSSCAVERADAVCDRVDFEGIQVAVENLEFGEGGLVLDRSGARRRIRAARYSS